MTVFLPEPELLDSPRGRPWPRLLAAAGEGRAGAVPPSADVVVVGAGPAGLAVMSALWHQQVRDVVLLDPGAAPCERFFGRIDALGQRVLRSPYEHHPGVEGFRDCELLDFARLHWGLLTATERREVRMAQAGHRSVVPVDVFEAYCAHVSATHDVPRNHWRATVREVVPDPEHLCVSTDLGTLTARFVVLCTGERRRAAPASWWAGERPPAGVQYWDVPVPPDADRVVVVGAGLSSAHLVSSALSRGARVEWVLRREEERYQCADVNASFFRPEGRARFGGGTWSERRALLRAERRASIMYEFRPRLRAAEREGTLSVHRGRPVTAVSDGRVTLGDGTRVDGDRVVLALGTEPSNGHELLGERIAGAHDGWPDLDPRTLALVRESRVHLVGPEAAPVLGPAARNIDGHRVATARVASAVAQGLRRGRPSVPEPASAVARG